MSIEPKYNLGNSPVYLDPNHRSWSSVVFQRGKLVLDSELLLVQDIRDLLQSREIAERVPSGFIRAQSRVDSRDDFIFDVPWLPGPVLNPAFQTNAFHMNRQQALVAGFLLDIDLTNTDTFGDNIIQLSPPTLYNGNPATFKRTDFVFLEVFVVLISSSPSAKGTLVVADPVTVAPGNTVTIGGTVLTATLLYPPGPNQFTLVAASATQTAKFLKESINTNVPSVTATYSGNIVSLEAAVAGSAGNLITLVSSNPTAIIPSGAALTGGVDTPNKPTQNTIYRNGNVLSSATVAFPDDIEDAGVGKETTKRLQVQYRIRTTDSSVGLDFVTEADGFSNVNILAQGTQLAPVANFPFVPADGVSIRLSSDASQYGKIDSGLWIAGDGTLASANLLGTADGYVYAIPIGFVFRRNQSAILGWNPEINTNGSLLHNHAPFVNSFTYAVVGTGESDRPDGAFADAINITDLLDLRRHVDLKGIDYFSELQYQIQSLMDGEFRTWAIDTTFKQELGAGSGDVSTQPLICNEIGRKAAQGGNPPLSGTTTRGVTIRNYDHVSRRFGSQPVVERVVIPYLPTSLTPGFYVTRQPYSAAFFGWAEGDQIHLDLTLFNVTNLGDFDPVNNTVAGVAGVFQTFAPLGTVITDVLSVFHDDGNFGVAVDQTVQVSSIIGLGTTHVVIQLDFNTTQVNGGLPVALHDMVGDSVSGDVGSQRRVFVEFEVSYPLGEGLTDTPKIELSPDPGPFPFGPMTENDLPFGSTQRPTDMVNPLPPAFRQGFREVVSEYVAGEVSGGGGPIVDTVVSRDPLTVIMPRRVYGDLATTIVVTDQNDLVVRPTDETLTEYGSSSRKVVLQLPLSGAGQTLISADYFAQDALPNYGPLGSGYQQSIYFRTNAPQTVGVKDGTLSVPGNAIFPYTGNDPLPNPIELQILAVSNQIWTGQVGMGSTELPVPYFAPLDQIPINDGRTEIPPPLGLFPGEWYFAANANISIADFDAQVGTLALSAYVPADGTTPWVLGGAPVTEVPFKDTEFRAVFPFVNKSGARPIPMTQGMSAPVRHKVFVPVLAKSTQDSAIFRIGEVLLVVLSRWAEFDDNNLIRFVDSGNRSGASIFRAKNLPLENI